MQWLFLVLVQQWLIVLLLASNATRSRVALAAALILVVPVAGPLLALYVCHARGVSRELGRDRRERPPHRSSADDVRRICASPPLLDRLMSSSTEERLGALASVSVMADAAAVDLLRWAVEHGATDVALDAAMTIDELDLQGRLELATGAPPVAAQPPLPALPLQPPKTAPLRTRRRRATGRRSRGPRAVPCTRCWRVSPHLPT